jgi:hypothetical protein
MQDRRSNDTFQREIITTLGDIRVLCERAACHHEAVAERVTKLENTNDRNFWVTHVATPMVLVFSGVARHYGVKI